MGAPDPGHPVLRLVEQVERGLNYRCAGSQFNDSTFLSSPSVIASKR